jgi:hypothetical protein
VSDTQTKEPADLRAAYDALKAEHSKLQREYTGYKAETTFKEAGLSAKHAELYLATNPDGDISPDTVKAFAEEYGLQPAQAPAAPQPAPAAEGHLPADGSPPAVERTLSDGAQPADAALAQVAAAAGSPQATIGAAAPGKMSRTEFQRLLETNPSAAAQAYAEGRVERNERNVQADSLQDKGFIR